MDRLMLGYDYKFYSDVGVKIPIYAPIGYLIVVGGSGSGKSTSILYWIYKLKSQYCKLYIVDFKASHEFEGITDKERFGEFEDAYDVILRFYDEFMNTPEGGEECYKILLIDEIAGLLTHYSMSKDGKAKADKIRNIMSSILMLGRSRKCFLWLSMQRYTASIFPASSGSADNFHIYVGLGRLTVDGRKGLFAGEHMEGEENLQFGMGKGIVLIDGQNLRALVLPKISKKKILGLLQN